MDFEAYVQQLRESSLDRPKRVVSAKTVSPANVPHEPGSLSQSSLVQYAGAQADRASEPSTGEIVGIDPATGESLVSQVGGTVTRAQVDAPRQGSKVSLDRTERVQGIRTQGTQITSSVTSNSGWIKPGDPRAEAGATSSKLTVSVTTRVEDFDLLSDPCVPPDVKYEIVGAAAAQNIFISDASGKPRIVGAGTGARKAQVEGYQYLNALYEESKAAGRQSQTLPQQVSLDSLGGRTTLDQEFSTGETLLWSCENGACVQSATGFYSTREACEAQCSVTSFNCVNGTCFEIQGGTGKFKTREACESSGCGSRYACVDGSPVASATGEFGSLEEAQASCFWGYNCVDGQCVPAVGGSYKSLQCCQTFCGQGQAFLYSVNGGQECAYTSGPLVLAQNKPFVAQALETSVLGSAPVGAGDPFALVEQALGATDLNDNTGTIYAQTGRNRIDFLVENLTVQFRIPNGLVLGSRAAVESYLGAYRYAENLVQVFSMESVISYEVLTKVTGNSQSPWSERALHPYSPYFFDSLRAVFARTFGSGSLLQTDQRWAPLYTPVYLSEGSYYPSYDLNYRPSAWANDFTAWYQEGDVLTVSWPPVTYTEETRPLVGSYGTFWESSCEISPGVTTSPSEIWNAESKAPGCFQGKFWQNFRDTVYLQPLAPGFDYHAAKIVMQDFPTNGWEYHEDFPGYPAVGAQGSVSRVLSQCTVTPITGEALPTSHWEARGLPAGPPPVYPNTREGLAQSLALLTNDRPRCSQAAALGTGPSPTCTPGMGPIS